MDMTEAVARIPHTSQWRRLQPQGHGQGRRGPGRACGEIVQEAVSALTELSKNGDLVARRGWMERKGHGEAEVGLGSTYDVILNRASSFRAI